MYRSAIFFGQQRAPPDRLDAEHLEVIAGDHLTSQLFDIFRPAKLELLDVISGQSGEYFVLLTEIRKSGKCWFRKDCLRANANSTSRSGPHGSGRKSTAFTKLKTAVFAPIPSARVMRQSP